MPAYTHDCERCTFLATIKVKEGFDNELIDLYHCSREKTHVYKGDSPTLNTVIARYSSEGWNFSSGMAFAKIALDRGNYGHSLAIAYCIATAMGLDMRE
jgi:hypothetical protein